MSRTFFTSDTHFGHKNIINLGAGRPFKDIQHHDEMLIKNWNDVVQPDDVVFHLGDVAMGPWPDGLNKVKRLNGFKVLIPGNHDRISSVEKPARRERFMDDYLAVFQKVLDEVVERDNVVMSHYPYTGESFEGRPDRFTDLRPVNGGKLLIHGHTHASGVVTYDQGTMQISVGVDAWGYAPVSQDQIMEVIKNALQ